MTGSATPRRRPRGTSRCGRPETGWHYNHFRYYDPETGRYAPPDPLGLVPSVEPGAYVPNPTRQIDPLGLQGCDVSGDEAKQQTLADAGVPPGSEPLDSRMVPSTTPSGRKILDEDYQPVHFPERIYPNNRDELILFQDHYTGHQFGEGGVGDQPPHVQCDPTRTPATARSPERRSTTITTPSWADRLLPDDAKLLARFYPQGPDFTGLVLRSIRFERRGPGCTLRVDLPVASDVPGYGYAQAHLGFLAVEDVRLSGATLPATVSIEFEERPRARPAVSVTGESLRLTLTCAEQFRFGRISTHNSPPDAVDDGPHEFASKLDQRLYTAVPGPEIDTYHEHI